MAKEMLVVSKSEFTGLNHIFDPETGKMTIRDGGNQIWSGRAKEGDAFVISHEGDKWQVAKRQYPHQKNHLLMWLMGYPAGKRFNEKLKAIQAIDQCRDAHRLERGYREYEYAGVGWMFMFYTTDTDLEPQRIAAWVTPEVDRRMAKEILGNKDLTLVSAEMDDSIGPILSERFGFRSSDMMEIRRHLM